MEAKFKALSQQVRASFPRDKRTQQLVFSEKVCAQVAGGDCALPPGCFVQRQALDQAMQLRLARACLEEYSHSPFTNVSLNHPEGAFTEPERLKKLRWSCLGYEYDWQNRCYLPDSRCAFPALLAELSVELTDRVGVRNHLPDGAIINYYRANSVMGPHRDDVEPALNKPLVSISLGCDAIFLIETKPFEEDSEVSAVHLRSGDVVILSGPARLALHSVAVIFFNTFACPERLGESDLALVDVLKTTRLNLNIKQVADAESRAYSFDRLAA